MRVNYVSSELFSAVLSGRRKNRALYVGFAMLFYHSTNVCKTLICFQYIYKCKTITNNPYR